jgi:DNA-binding response OmpR family regulator
MKKTKSESGTILVVNAEEAIRNLIRRVLESANYRVLETNDAEEGLEICRREVERIDLLLIEVMMPRVGGRALIKRAATLRSRIKVIYMSKNVDLLLGQGVLTPEMVYLRKPFTAIQVLEKVREVLRQRSQESAPFFPLKSFDWLLTLNFRQAIPLSRLPYSFLWFWVKLRGLVGHERNAISGNRSGF